MRPSGQAPAPRGPSAGRSCSTARHHVGRRRAGAAAVPARPAAHPGVLRAARLLPAVGHGERRQHRAAGADARRRPVRAWWPGSPATRSWRSGSPTTSGSPRPRASPLRGCCAATSCATPRSPWSPTSVSRPSCSSRASSSWRACSPGRAWATRWCTPSSGVTCPILQATALVLALLIVAINTAVDLVGLWLDPRPRRPEAARMTTPLLRLGRPSEDRPAADPSPTAGGRRWAGRVAAFALVGPLVLPDPASQDLARFLEAPSLGRAAGPRRLRSQRHGPAGACDPAVAGAGRAVRRDRPRRWARSPAWCRRGSAAGSTRCCGRSRRRSSRSRRCSSCCSSRRSASGGSLWALYVGLALAQWVEYFRVVRARSGLVLGSPRRRGGGAAPARARARRATAPVARPAPAAHHDGVPRHGHVDPRHVDPRLRRRSACSRRAPSWA